MDFRPAGIHREHARVQRYLAAGGFAEGMWPQVERALAKVERLAASAWGTRPIRSSFPALRGALLMPG